MDLDFKFHRKFWFKIDFLSKAPCWDWIGAKTADGYGILRHGGKNLLAHRAIMGVFGWLEDKLVVDHTCRNRTCVNPKHLRMATSKQNVLENSQSPAYFNAKKTHCKRGHPLTGENLLIRRKWKYNTTYRLCKSCYKMHQILWKQKQSSEVAEKVGT